MTLFYLPQLSLLETWTSGAQQDMVKWAAIWSGKTLDVGPV